MKKKTPQDIQDRIFRKMPVSKKIRLASDFSRFLLKLHKINFQNGISRTTEKNR